MAPAIWIALQQYNWSFTGTFIIKLAITLINTYKESFLFLHTFRKHLIVELSPHAPVIRTDHILITSTEWQDVMFTPSRSDIEFVSGRNTYIALAQVTNLGTTHFTGIAFGKFELMNKSYAIPLEHNSKEEIRNLF